MEDDVDEITGVTYGGVTVNEVTGSPVSSSAGGAAGMSIHAFFLGAGLGTGGKTVEVTCSGSVQKHAWAVTVTGAADTEVVDTTTLNTTGTTVSGTLSLGGSTCFCAGLGSLSSPGICASGRTQRTWRY
jgi:hypothetical protein